MLTLIPVIAPDALKIEAPCCCRSRRIEAGEATEGRERVRGAITQPFFQKLAAECIASFAVLKALIRDFESMLSAPLPPSPSALTPYSSRLCCAKDSPGGFYQVMSKGKETQDDL